MPWDADQIRSLLDALRVHRGDSTLVEVKRAAGGLPSNTASTVCAFANMPDGGTVLLGVDEASGFAVTGVADPAGMEAALVNQARSQVTPAPFIATSTVDVDGKHVVVAEVSPLRLADKPATVAGRAYLRQADGDFVMHEHELRMIEIDKLTLPEQHLYDAQIVQGLTVDDLVPELVESYLMSARARDHRLHDANDAEILRWTGVVVSSGEPTLAGLYALGDYPQGTFPSLAVTAAVQEPSGGGARNRDLQTFTGPVPVLLDDLMAWSGRNLLAVRAYRDDGHMTEHPEIPLSAVRELIANALVHRDLGPNTLGIGKSIQVRLTPTSFFVLSPGGLRGVSVEQLTSEDHAQAAVNQRLYAIAQKLRTADGSYIIEGEGGGIREVFRSARGYGLRAPSLINTGVQFKALLFRPESLTLPPESEQARPGGRAEEMSSDNRHGTSEQATAEPTVLLTPIGAGQSEYPDFTPAPDPARTTKHEPLVLRSLGLLGTASLRDLIDDTGLTSGQVRYALVNALRSGTVDMVGRQGRRDTVYRLRGTSTP